MPSLRDKNGARPIGAFDGSRGIHPTGLMRHTINRHVRDGKNVLRQHSGGYDNRGMNSPSTIMLSQRDENGTSPIGAFDGSRGIYSTD